ncbi:MAG: DUF763 domain-containing protein [Archaeoglobus sp.]|nr:DUF763 domain-containing protein [Archaeoglobus sp.]
MKPNSIALPLHYGKAPFWLLDRMKKLSRIIISLIIEEYGENEFIKRISNPIFFQSFSNVLGFDWNSSGTTTVLTGVLKSVLNDSEFAIKIAGGKGRLGVQTPQQLEVLGEKLGLGEEEIGVLKKNSKLAARIDNNALQDGYDLYHHAIVFSEDSFTVIQQGMNAHERMARRYHFVPEKFRVISVEEPHSAIVAEKKETEVCNLTSRQSRESRKTILDILRSPMSLKRDLELLSVKKVHAGQTTIDGRILSYQVPRRLNWDAIEKAYELQPEKFENVLMIDGMGKNTLRALALVADLIYNAQYDRQDPARYSFAVGGKDGVPFPVDRKVYDETIEFLESLIEQTTLDRFEKEKMISRLRK